MNVAFFPERARELDRRFCRCSTDESQREKEERTTRRRQYSRPVAVPKNMEEVNLYGVGVHACKPCINTAPER